MAKRAVTERDLRLPEFADCELSDLEHREDGTIARKDRWERAIRSIANIVGLDPRKTFEVEDVIRVVQSLVAREAPAAHPPVDVVPDREE